MIREIDDRYPEFARPYEPVKGRKKYKKLGAGPFLGAILACLAIFTFLTSKDPKPPLVPEEPVIAVTPVQAEEPTPEPSPTTEPEKTPAPTPTPAPTATPTPRPSPSPTPRPVPVPIPSPTPEPTPEYIPEPIPIPIPDPDPDPDPDPSPSPSPTPTPATEPEFVAVNNHVDLTEGVDLEYFWLDKCSFKINMNKAAEHDAKITLKFLEPYMFDEPYEREINYLSGETELTDGVWTDDFNIAASNVELTLSQSAILVLEYTKEDGSTGTLNSNEFNMYLGGYARSTDEFEYAEGVFSAFISIEGVDTSEVELTRYVLTFTPTTGDPIKITTLPDEEKSDFFITLKSNVVLEPGTRYIYQVEAYFTYTDSTGTVWEDYCMYGGLINE